MKYLANINKNKEKSVELQDDKNTIKIAENTHHFDVIKDSSDFWHMLVDRDSYNVEILEIDKAAKTVDLKINNTPYSVSLKDELDIMLNKLGINMSMTKTIKELKAPMPGLVIDLLVKEGDEIKEGEALLILEAMKMENVLTAPNDVVIDKIVVTKGETIEKNTVLIKFKG